MARAAVLASVAACTLVTCLWNARAQAHGSAPAPQAALAVDGVDVLLLRSNIGLARRLESGSYEYICPSRWDGNELALAVSDPNGEWVFVHSAGRGWISDDLGCSFEALDVGGNVVAAAAWAGALLIVVDSGRDAHDLVLVEQQQITHRWLTERVVDAAAATNGELWLAGATSESFAGRLTADGRLDPLFRLDGDFSRVSPIASDGRGLWLLVDDIRGRGLWWVDARGARRLAPEFETLLGPVRVAGQWLAVFDGVLHAMPVELATTSVEVGIVDPWSPLDAVDWTCLHELEGRAYVCTLSGLFELAQLQEASTDLVWRFSWNQLGGPSQCPGVTVDCEVDWAHFGAESGWLDAQPSRAPTDPRRSLGDAGERADAGAFRRAGEDVLDAGLQADVGNAAEAAASRDAGVRRHPGSGERSARDAGASVRARGAGCAGCRFPGTQATAETELTWCLGLLLLVTHCWRSRWRS